MYPLLRRYSTSKAQKRIERCESDFGATDRDVEPGSLNRYRQLQNLHTGKRWFIYLVFHHAPPRGTRPVALHPPSVENQRQCAARSTRICSLTASRSRV